MLYDKRWEQKSIELEPWQRILLDAAEIIETHGWCQGSGIDSRGSYCASGAMAVAQRALGLNAWRVAGAKATIQMMNSVGTGIMAWNDQPARTAAEVVAKLREVARS